MNTEEIALLTESLEKTIANAAPKAGRGAVTDFGFYELLAEDPDIAVQVLAGLQGSKLTGFSFLDDVMLTAAGFELDGATGVLVPCGPSAPGSRLSVDAVELRGVARRDAQRLVAPVLDAEGNLALVTTPAPDPQAGTTEPGGMDPDAAWAWVSATVAPDDVTIVAGDAAAAAWQQMQVAGRRFLAHELVAVGGAMLVMTVDHVTTREQFGQPLAAFQVVKHKLADVRLWQDAASVAADAAWEDASPHSAALAKGLAVRFSRTARENCQQLLGGMGFTWEHDFHHYLRRALVLEPMLGSAAAVRGELGAALRAGMPLSVGPL